MAGLPAGEMACPRGLEPGVLYPFPFNYASVLTIGPSSIGLSTLTLQVFGRCLSQLYFEMLGIEPGTLCVQSRCSSSELWAFHK